MLSIIRDRSTRDMARRWRASSPLSGINLAKLGAEVDSHAHPGYNSTYSHAMEADDKVLVGRWF